MPSVSPAYSPVAAARGLVLRAEQHPDNVALIAGDGVRLTHRELAHAVAARAHAWGPGRRLVMIEGSRTAEQVISYLAALEHGHVALVVTHGRDHSEIVETWNPDIVALDSGTTIVRDSSTHDLHPDLALLLSTSGTTGSPKLVRLSAEAVKSNAEAIAEYLGLSEDDVALSSLPLHYCYGLSVLHSHLATGGAIALTDTSVVDPCFWSAAREVGATSLAGVPHTFELLTRSEFAHTSLPSLRRFTQAGGRLAPDQVRAWAERGQREGWDMVVMYGATEATARMAWLPPELAQSHAGSIGRAIPGGHLRLDPVPESTDPDVGELVYTGPNVMLGYAVEPADLAAGRTVHELRTGDLAREVDGLFEVQGRRNRQVKAFGLRIDLDRLDRHLEQTTRTAVHSVVADDVVHLFLPHGRTAKAIREQAQRFCGLPVGAVRSHVLAELPRTENGKIDLIALTALAAESAAPTEPLTGTVAERVRAAYGLVLGRPDPDSSASFIELGGDSLSYVELATRLEQVLGQALPSQWHLQPMQALWKPQPTTGPTARTLPRLRGSIDTLVLLRALAILAIVASHVDLIDFKGGAHLLLVLAGFNIARFQLGSPQRKRRVLSLATGLAQVVATSVVWIGAVSVFTHAYNLPTVFLSNLYFGSKDWNDQWQYWFLEVLVWCTVALLALMAIPRVHAAERRYPFAFALSLVGGTAALRFAIVGIEAGPDSRYTLGATAFLVALGWAAARAVTNHRRMVVMACAVALVPGFFGEPVREAVVVLGLALVLFVSRVRCPAPIAGGLSVLAGASLSIYLTHWLIYPPLEDAGLPWLALVASLAVGIAHAYLVRPVNRWLARRINEHTSRVPTASATLPAPAQRVRELSATTK